MTQLFVDEEGPGSFEDFTVIPEKDMTVPPNNQYNRRARNIVMSLLSRQGITIR